MNIKHAKQCCAVALCLGSLAMVSPPAMAGPLNDTGIDFCGGATSGNAPCDGSQPAGQDAHYGRDAQPPSKVGGGGKGFDFTALDAGGQPTAPSTGATPHPCVRDNVTGLVWEVKTDDGGLHDKDWTYTWYKTDSPDGNNGTASGGNCGGTVAAGCDTEKYVTAVKNAHLCSYNDWRMPTRKELQDLVDYGRFNPSIDTTYFPNTPGSVFWSGSPYAGSTDYAWYVDFNGGAAGYHGNYPRDTPHHVRLVRGGQ